MLRIHQELYGTTFGITDETSVCIAVVLLADARRPDDEVTVVVPGDTAVTRPEEETVATSVLLETQVTDLSVALEGVTVAVRV